MHPGLLSARASSVLIQFILVRKIGLVLTWKARQHYESRGLSEWKLTSLQGLRAFLRASNITHKLCGQAETSGPFLLITDGLIPTVHALSILVSCTYEESRVWGINLKG